MYIGIMRRPARRITDIVSILVRYGFRDWLSSIHIRPRGLKKLKPGRSPRQSRPERIRLAIEEMGPTFIKFGQLLSIRKDIIPQPYIRELSRLQDDVAPIDSQEAKNILVEELGSQYSILEFEEKPQASASIAQVHRVTISGYGEMAVKIQRPGIEQIIEEDISILNWIATQVEHYIPALRPLQPVNLVKEFAKTLRKELNFRVEAQNIIRFSRNFRNSKSIKVPRVYPDISTEKVLLMEFVHGQKLSRLLRDPERMTGEERHRIARDGSRAIIDQVFIHAFFHADPHPGNILVLPDNRLCFLDFGIMGQISPSEQERLHQAIISVTSNDYERLAEIVLSLVGRSGDVDTDAFRTELFEIIDQYINLPLENIQVSTAVQEIFRIITNHHLIIPSKYLLMNKAIITIDGVAKELEPGFTLAGLISTVVRKVLRQQFNPKRARRTMVEITSDYASLAKAFPRESRDILSQLRQGRLGILFKIEGIEPLRKTLDELGSRLIYGIILTAVLVSSSLIFSSGLPPLWKGVPVIGLAGFAIAGIMALNYVLNLIRHYFRERWK
ncbi:Ubiquinone biosynthesis monooxygenase UbiB [Salinispira pacifica]|uniref:Ubiquinone biosynthesis monooxygenase UbiB n=2 Tax=Salinispira pacifica TaxID=1307761 RepID=V5WLV7_9SPIO|nr:Ubiquinone biosynthesis monooxygenase UbiB [Salinispira pacifica]